MSLTSYRAAPPRGMDTRQPLEIDPAANLRLRWVRGSLTDLGGPGGDLLSRVLRQSTIGAEAFDGRVRDGIGSYRLARATRPAKGGTEYRGRRTQDGRDPLPVFCRLNEAKLVFARRGGRRRRERRIRSLFSVFG